MSHNHARCEGANTLPTQAYTPKLAGIVHRAFAENAVTKGGPKVGRKHRRKIVCVAISLAQTSREPGFASAASCAAAAIASAMPPRPPPPPSVPGPTLWEARAGDAADNERARLDAVAYAGNLPLPSQVSISGLYDFSDWLWTSEGLAPKKVAEAGVSVPTGSTVTGLSGSPPTGAQILATQVCLKASCGSLEQLVVYIMRKRLFINLKTQRRAGSRRPYSGP